VDTAHPLSSFKPGMKVRVLAGAFRDFHGVIQEVDLVQQTAEVLVNFFGKTVPATLAFSELSPL
jgi:transcription antitermination factor NusG